MSGEESPLAGAGEWAPWDLLSVTERVALRFARFCNRHATWLAVVASFFPVAALVWAGACRRFRIEGDAHVRDLPRDSSVLFMANHRSLFDYFVILSVMRLKAGFRHRIVFPVRTEFFYTNPFGILLNLLTSGMSMYPPVFRHGAKRAFNDQGLAECIGIVTKPGSSIGFHPEGTRGRGPDPFQLLPPRDGAGRLALAVPHTRVIPVFVLGIGNGMLKELAWNVVSPKSHPVWVYFGEDVDLSDLRTPEEGDGESEEIARTKAASVRIWSAIADLGRRVEAAAGADA